MVEHDRDVSFVPKADSRTAANCVLFDHFVGACNKRGWKFKAERLCGLGTDLAIGFAQTSAVTHQPAVHHTQTAAAP
jgi:hypothetical protein